MESQAYLTDLSATGIEFVHQAEAEYQTRQAGEAGGSATDPVSYTHLTLPTNREV